jgi:mercuric ion transport protein
MAMIDTSRSERTEPRTQSANTVRAGFDRSVKPEHTEAEKQGRALIGAGLAAAGLAVICCLTPLLVVVWPAVGLGAWLAGADWILLPLLFVSVGVMVLGFIRRRARTDACCETESPTERI